MKKELMKVLMFAAAMVVTFASCEDDEKPISKLPTPEIVQHEQTSENPISLAFSWNAVDGAEYYEYELYTGTDADTTVILSGTTTQTSLSVVSSKDTLLSFDTHYTFAMRALKVGRESDIVRAEVTTSAAPFKMTITDLSYRGATFTVVPSDPNMLYQTAQTDWEKYAQYDTDQAFIEGYEFGYYQSMPPFFVPWYAKMESYCQKGEYSWTTRILSPGKSYIFYSYGITMQTDNQETPVLVSTPLVKTKFTAPEFKPTSNTTFDVTSVNQTIENGKVVSTIKVVPSSNNEKYLVAFAEDDYVNEKFDGSDFSMMMGRMGDMEIMGTVKNYNWGASGLLHSGEITIANNATGQSLDANINPGKKYHAIVLGVTDDGIQTTEIKRIDLTAPAE